MNIPAFYQAIGHDCEDACKRLSSQAALEKFLPRFAQDETFFALCTAMEENRPAEAFRAAHTLKGLAANFGFTHLYECSSALTELLRAGSLLGTQDAFARTKKAYFAVIDAMRQNGITES